MNTEQTQTNLYSWARHVAPGQRGYEVSTQGDRRFSALNARLQDGRTIEEAYQLDVKGYRTSPTDRDWSKGKGKLPLRQLSREELYAEYKALWQQWAVENPQLVAELAQQAQDRVITDKFASTPVSQARALAELLNEGYGQNQQTTQKLPQAASLTSPLQSPPLIEVINQRDGKPADGIPGDRASVLGNPFDMGKNEALRDPVCDAYDAYYEAVMYGGEEPRPAATRIAQERGLSLARTWKRPTRAAFVDEVERLEGLAQAGQPLKIMCWCAKARCHLDTVKRDLTLRWERSQAAPAEAQVAELPQVPETPLQLSQPAPDRITSLAPNQVFVFGSNTVGHHGGGAAGYAFRGDATPHYEDIQGQVGKWCVGGTARGYQEGTEGRSYAIATKDAQLRGGKVTIGSSRSIPLPEIAAQIQELLDFAHNQPQLEFLVSEFGTQLAGYSTTEIGQLWAGKAIPPNVRLPQAFIDVQHDPQITPQTTHQPTETTRTETHTPTQSEAGATSTPHPAMHPTATAKTDDPNQPAPPTTPLRTDIEVCQRAAEVGEPVQFLIMDHPYAHWVEAAIQKVRKQQWEGVLAYTPILVCRNTSLPAPDVTQRKYLLCLSDQASAEINQTLNVAASMGVHVVGYNYAREKFFQQTQEAALAAAPTRQSGNSR